MLTVSLLSLIAGLFGGGEPLQEPTEHGLTREWSPWRGEIGEGFAKNARTVEVKLSRAFGLTDTGSDFTHNLWLAQVQGGVMVAEVMEPDFWFGGNLEGTGQLMGGGQDRPEGAYLFGLNGGLRYHFRTGGPLVPFLGGSFGLALTDIGNPDASSKFQFNQQAAAGAHYFVDRRHAISLEYAYWHVSNGGIRQPNAGVNAHVVSVGLAWLF